MHSVPPAAAARSLVRVHDLHLVLDAFASAGIEALAFKGPVLDADLRGDPFARDCDDLDLLVRRGELDRALAVLGRAGWTEAVDVHPRSRGTLLRTGSEVPLVRPGRTTIDLHWDLVPACLSWRTDPEAIRARARTVDVAGRPVPTLSRGDTLLHLCVHGCRSHWARAIWAEDVALAVAALGPEDAALVLGEARSTGAVRMLAVGLALAADLHGVSAPAALRVAAGGDPEAAALARLYAAILRGTARLPSAAADLLALRLRSRERLLDRARIVAGTVRTPALEECRAPLAPAPVRWAGRLARGIRGWAAAPGAPDEAVR
jgi:hypothetical protein